MKKTKDQFTVICEGLFLNDSKPDNWAEMLEGKGIKYFPWEAGVGFHYRLLGDDGEPIGDTQKKTKKELWLFQAMGGKNAVGKYFRLEAEHGEIPAKEGNPAKPYISVMPIAEVFSDGQARFLEAPKDGKINVPASTDKPKGPVTPGKPKGPVTPEAASALVPPKGGPANPPAKPTAQEFADPNTARVANFFKKMEIPQSNEWWLSKTHLNYDVADACNVLDYAKQMALMEVAKDKFEGENPIEECRGAMNEAMQYWAETLRPRLLAMKFQNIEERLTHYTTLAITTDDLNTIILRAWTELPESFFLRVRSAAYARIKVVKSLTDKDGKFTGSVTGTLQPEIKIAPISPMEDDPVEEEYRAEAEHPAEAPVKPAGPDKAFVDKIVATIGTLENFKNLMKYWETTSPQLQGVEDIRQAMRLWVADFYMRSKYQANVSGIIEGFPKALMTPELEKTLADRYSVLAPF